MKSHPSGIRCVHALFEAQAERTPGAEAVTDGTASLTYRELERRSNQLAWHLRSMGVEPEVRVGLCLDRGTDALVGALGILKAGGAYVPLDSAYPRPRLELMVEDSSMPVVVTSSDIWSGL